MSVASVAQTCLTSHVCSIGNKLIKQFHKMINIFDSL